MERSFTKEEKERRAALRREAVRRQRALEQSKTVDSAPAPAPASTPPSSSAAEPAEEPSPCFQVAAISLQLAGCGLTDAELAARCNRWRVSLDLGEAVWPASGFVVDLCNNQITDKGLADFLAFLCDRGAQPEELLLTDNPLKEPDSLCAFLKNERSGLGRGGKLWRLDIAAGQFTERCFWKFLEACAEVKPRPPLRLGVLKGELGALRKAFEIAERKHGLHVHWSGFGPGKPVPSYTMRLGINADLELVCAEPPDPQASAWQ